MTIKYAELRAQYEAHAQSGHSVYATIADEAWQAVRDVIASRGLRADNADLAEDLVSQIFAYAWDSNNRPA